MQFAFAVLACALPVLTAAEPRHGTLRVVTTGHPSDEGQVLLALCATPEQLARKGSGDRFARAKPVDGRTELLITDLPAGDYAIKVFQDVNENRELDIGLFGPKEPYGFSNDARGSSGPPSWEAVRFHFDGTDQTVEIAMRE